MRILDAIWPFRYDGTIPDGLEGAILGQSLTTYGWVWLLVGAVLPPARRGIGVELRPPRGWTPRSTSSTTHGARREKAPHGLNASPGVAQSIEIANVVLFLAAIEPPTAPGPTFVADEGRLARSVRRSDHLART